MKIFINTLWVFSVFSFLGWVVQFVIRSVRERRAVNPGFINLPFSPACGFGAVLISLAFYRTDSWYLVFFGSAIILTVGKFIYSMLFERVFGFKWMDYDKKSVNLNGYVSLWDAFIYGAVGLILKLFAFEPMYALAGGMPRWLSILIPAVITGLITGDFIITVIEIFHLRRNLKQMKNISALLNDNSSDKTDEQLRAEYDKKLVKSKRFRARLIKAFPDMQSVNYEKQLADIKNKFQSFRELNEMEYEKAPGDAGEKPFAYGLSFTKLFWLFFIGSVFGTVLETIWACFTMGHFEMRVGLVWGPFIPVYGGGAVVITLCLYRLHKASDLIIYIASGIIGATFEYFCSYFQEILLGTVSWDYSDTPFNIEGRTNLMFALIWGLLGLCWLRYVYPAFSRFVEKIPKKIGKIVTVILVVFMMVDAAVSVTAVYRKNQRDNHIPPQNAVTELVDRVFNDDYMDFVFPHMSPPESWGKD